MENILNTEDASKYLKISKGTLYKLVKAGKIPAMTVGRLLRFGKRELENYTTEKTKSETLSRIEKHNKTL